MELFKVICVTCQAKLSVRNEALIGQIVACPRCESMVEVARPAASPNARPEGTKPASAATAGASTGSTINITARQVEELGEFADAAAVVQPNANPVKPEPVGNADAIATEAIAAEAIQASAAVARYKLITWSIASFVVGAAVVGAVVYKSTRSETQTHETPQVAAAPQKLNEEVKLEPQVKFTEPVDTTIQAPVESEPAALPSAEENAPTNVAVNEPLTLAPKPAPIPVELPEPIAPKQSQTEPKQRLTVEPASPQTRRFDPLDVDLESLSLDAVEQPRPPHTEAVEIPDPDEVAIKDLEQPPAEPVPATRPPVKLGPQDDNEIANRDAARQLTLIIPTVEAREMPLVNALRLISQLSGQPISVAPEQLLMAGITPQKKVSLQVADRSMGDALRELLDPLRLEYATTGPQIIIRRQAADMLRQIEYPIDDLMSGDQNEAEIAGWIEQLVAPATWQAAGGDGTLKITEGKLSVTQPQQVQYQVLIMLERLRLARNLPPRSRYPVERLAGTPAQLVLADSLDEITTFTFLQFTTLEEVFSYWQSKLDVPLLIDWPALAESDIWPSTTITAAVVDQPWRIALGQVLNPIGLGWRAATGGAIEITTTVKVENELQLELYPLRPTSTIDLSKLRGLTTDDSGIVLHDAVGNVVLSLQPAVTQRLILGELIRQKTLSP